MPFTSSSKHIYDFDYLQGPCSPYQEALWLEFELLWVGGNGKDLGTFYKTVFLKPLNRLRALLKLHDQSRNATRTFSAEVCLITTVLH